MYLAKKIEAPNGRPLRVLTLSRISTMHQDERSLDEQNFQAQEELATCYSGSVEWVEIATQGSGDLLDTAAHHELKKVIENREVDLIILEDLGRIARRIDTHSFCELCQLNGVRLISIREQVDTIIEGWEDVSILSLWHHERSNRETSKRIKRTKRGRFLSDGPIHQVIFGYIKPSGTKSDTDVLKDPEVEEFAMGIVTKLEAAWTYAEVAEWLNRNRVPVGPNCGRGLPETEKLWTGVMIRRWIHNEVIGGVRVHNKTETVRKSRDGRRGQIKCPPDRILERQVRHLAYISRERHRRLLAKLAQRNKGWGRRPGEAFGTRTRSDFPGSALTCGICGRPFVFGMRGDSNKLACSGLRHNSCWCGNSVDMEVVDRKLREAVYNALMLLAGTKGLLVESVREAAIRQADGVDAEKKRLTTAIAEKKREIRNVLQQTALGHAPPALNQFLTELELELSCLEEEIAELERQPTALHLPDDSEILDLAREELFALDRTDPIYARGMRSLLPVIELFPVRPIDADKIGSRVVFRARVEMNLLALPGVDHCVGDSGVRTQTIIVDLFDRPARIQLAHRVEELRLQGMTQREIRDNLGTHLPTVQNAAALFRKMRAAGTTDPYVPVTEPVDTRVNATHLNSRYVFRPREGFPKRLD